MNKKSFVCTSGDMGGYDDNSKGKYINDAIKILSENGYIVDDLPLRMAKVEANKRTRNNDIKSVANDIATAMSELDPQLEFIHIYGLTMLDGSKRKYRVTIDCPSDSEESCCENPNDK